MKLILLFSCLISFGAWADDVKLTLSKGSVFTGEIVSARVENYRGPELTEKKIGDTLYLVKLNETSAEIVFLKKPSVHSIALNENDSLMWNPVDVTEINVPENVLLNELSFSLKNNKWIYVLIISLLIVCGGASYYWMRIKPLQVLKRERRLIKDELFNASTYSEITKIWENKHRYLEAFPFIEEEFNKFEAIFYKHAFKPNLLEDEKKEITKIYHRFLEQIRGGKYGV